MSRTVNKPKVRRRPSLSMRRWITRAEFESLMEAGVFPREERLELIAGELTRMEAVNTAHAVAVVLVSEVLQQVLPKNLHFRVQLSLALSEYDEPFPDLAVVSGSPRDYVSEHPATALL